jgi:hypothetical protein
VSQLQVLAEERPRDGKQRFLRTPEQIELDHEAADLRRQSWTFKAIGENFGITESAAYKMVQRAIEDIPREGTQELVQIELAKLDYLERKASDIMERNHAYVGQNGKVVYLEDNFLTDDEPVMKAMALLLKISDRRARLLGLNAPVRSELTSTVSITLEDKSAQAKGAVLGLLARLKDEQKAIVEG